MAGRQDGIPIAEAAARLGLSAEAVRKRLQRGTLHGYKDDDGGWFVLLGELGEVSGRQDTGRTDRQDDGRTSRPDVRTPPEEPIEAPYRVTPAAIEQAVSRTGVQYVGDLRTMLAEVGKVYEGQLAAKDAALEAKDQALAADALTIAELRRRAEVAEEEVVRRRSEEAERLARVSALVREREAASGIRRSGSMLRKQLDQVSDEQEAREAWGAAPPAPLAPTFWERVRARLRGE